MWNWPLKGFRQFCATGFRLGPRVLERTKRIQRKCLTIRTRSCPYQLIRNAVSRRYGDRMRPQYPVVLGRILSSGIFPAKLLDAARDITHILFSVRRDRCEDCPTHLPCLALCGDGGILPQTPNWRPIVRYNIPVVIFVDNNMSYAILENAMRSRYQISGSMYLNNPDFVKLARSYGIRAKQQQP